MDANAGSIERAPSTKVNFEFGITIATHKCKAISAAGYKSISSSFKLLESAFSSRHVNLCFFRLRRANIIKLFVLRRRMLSDRGPRVQEPGSMSIYPTQQHKAASASRRRSVRESTESHQPGEGWGPRRCPWMGNQAIKDEAATGTVSTTDICFLGDLCKDTAHRQLKQEEQIPSQPH